MTPPPLSNLPSLPLSPLYLLSGVGGEAMTLSMPKAELLGTFLEILSYGLYLILQIECLRVLWVKHRSGKPMHYLVGTSVAIFSLVTIHLAIDIVRVMNAFTTQMNVPDAPVLYYGKSNTSLSLTKTAVYVAVTLVSDILIVYRTFIIWDRRYLVAAGPFLLFLADIATSIWATWSLKEAKPGSNVLMADVTLRAKYFYAITLALNCICTALISWKIWAMKRRASNPTIHVASMSSIVSVILESAAVYSFLLIILISTSIMGEMAMFVVLNAISPIIGIVFSSVIVRISRESLCNESRLSFRHSRITFSQPPEHMRQTSSTGPFIVGPATEHEKMAHLNESDAELGVIEMGGIQGDGKHHTI